MTGGNRDALEALQRRLGHAEAIAGLIAEPLDTPVGEALRGVALMLSDLNDQLEEIIAPLRRSAEA
ncbi:hypothetical protein [Sphingomonas faeni]|uniref:hypothetical protein n=1 Tax=Sphingomonas faeni TaxID=185950 RepID=UPI0020C7ADA9|nr:hypothetical protein [Sphingomonas faeni]MCP8892523.1 hypothetical protein [Sphingomonas faeni]